MPEARNELPWQRKYRQGVHGPLRPMSVTNLAALTSVIRDELIAPESEDGLGAWHYRLPAGQSATGHAPSAGNGQHWVVLSGRLEGRDGKILPVNSCIFLSPEEGSLRLNAGPEGVEILVLQYPLQQKH